MRLLLLAAAALLLSGCYESDGQLLDPAAARQPVTVAKDWTYGRVHARLSPRPNGWYDYAESRRDRSGAEGPWKNYAVLLNALTSVNGSDLFVFATYNKDDSAYLYGVVAVGKDGAWQAIIPSCDTASGDARWFRSDIKAALAAGARIKAIDEASNVCHFTRREQVVAAMQAVVAAPGFWDRVKAARHN